MARKKAQTQKSKVGSNGGTVVIILSNMFLLLAALWNAL